MKIAILGISYAMFFWKRSNLFHMIVTTVLVSWYITWLKSMCKIKKESFKLAKHDPLYETCLFCWRWSIFLCHQLTNPGKSWKSLLIYGKKPSQKDHYQAISCIWNQTSLSTVSLITIARNTQLCSMLLSWLN